jgi:prepilin-type processing-associated H-X9-DG protein
VPDSPVLNYGSPEEFPISQWAAFFTSGILLLLAASPFFVRSPDLPLGKIAIAWFILIPVNLGLLIFAMRFTRRFRSAFLITRIARGITATSILLASLIVILPGFNSSDAYSTRPAVQCASNLRQIGQAIQLYASENSGHYPPTLRDLLLTQEIGPEAFICPESSLTPATGPTTRAIADSMMTAHCSYAYLGAAYTSNTPKNAVVAYELAPGHAHVPRPGSINVLFADGNVQMLTPRQFQSITKQIANHDSIVVWPKSSADLPD